MEVIIKIQINTNSELLIYLQMLERIEAIIGALEYEIAVHGEYNIHKRIK